MKKNVSDTSIYEPKTCEIIEITDLTDQEKLFKVFLVDGSELAHKPGQFVQISIFGYGEAPISICNSPSRTGYFELAIRRAGFLSDKMHSLKKGDHFSIRGPFGSCFDVGLLGGNNLVLISGGCGLAPMRSLIQYCEDHREEFESIHILHGARSPDAIMFKPEVNSWQESEIFHCHLTVDTKKAGSDDCYNGKTGLITELIDPLEINSKKTVAVIVGPPIMYKPVIEKLSQKGLTDYQILVSLERYMRCGFGKCGHCRLGHLYCCVDGPVFWLNEIRKVDGAI